MNKRILVLRKALKMNKAEFARELGMTETAIRSWENNTNTLKESSILLIIRSFNVNPDWLHNGKGAMFIPESTVWITPEAEKIFEWIKSLSPQEQALADIEIQNKVEQYCMWRKK